MVNARLALGDEVDGAEASLEEEGVGTGELRRRNHSLQVAEVCHINLFIIKTSNIYLKHHYHTHIQNTLLSIDDGCIDIIQLMTKKLSDAFFGDKKFTEKVYGELLSSGEVEKADIEMIFEPYTSKLQAISCEGGISLLDLFVQFIQSAIQEFRIWSFQKLSSAVQIAAHVFEHSFEEWLSRQQSFKYFSDVLVRHSLFRPPHSVCIFNYEEFSLLTSWWLTHFDRYYEEYQQCMASSLNEVLLTCSLPSDNQEHTLGDGRVVDKSEANRFLQ